MLLLLGGIVAARMLCNQALPRPPQAPLPDGHNLKHQYQMVNNNDDAE